MSADSAERHVEWRDVLSVFIDQVCKCSAVTSDKIIIHTDKLAEIDSRR